MSLADSLRRRTLRLIASDPTTITITRWVHVSKPAGGVKLEPVQLEPQTVRLYPKRGLGGPVAAPRTVGLPHAWSLIAAPTADVMPGDEFEASGCKLKVLAVRQETFRGAVVCLTADLEEVRSDAGE